MTPAQIMLHVGAISREQNLQRRLRIRDINAAMSTDEKFLTKYLRGLEDRNG